MLRIIVGCLLSISCVFNAFAIPPTNKIDRVIYVTLDGVRWQDVFNDHPYFPKLWGKYASAGVFYGAPGSNTHIEVASIPISMPSYQSQMAGAVQPCDGNGCGRIQVETVAENILHKLGLNKKDVATFASWGFIELAVEHIPGVTFSNTGNLPVYDPITHQADTTMTVLNQQQAADSQGGIGGYRFDKYTFAQALHYLETYQPRFLWISLGDTDEWAHIGSLMRYRQALAAYDDMIDTLFVTLKNLNIDKNTLVIITTDHGRGDGIHWTDHGPKYPESKQTWAFVMNGTLVPIDSSGQKYSTLSIRPTLEQSLNIKS